MTSLTQTSPCETPDLPIVNISAYRFIELSDLEQRRSSMRTVADQCRLRGTVLLSPEGINMFLAGERGQIDDFLAHVRQDPLLKDLETKESFSDRQPFNRMLIKIKQEIIAFGIEDVDPIKRSSPKLTPAELKKWLDEGRQVHLLDTRNDYEIEVGTFENAIPAGVDHFRDFPEAVERLPEKLKNEPIVMFCTGGIRCEKAGPFMEQAGFKQVYQLEGGILKYFEDCGGDHYDGDCFVFDQRVALDSSLRETGYTQCYICQEVVSPEGQKSELYVAGESCPLCYRKPQEKLAERLQQRNTDLQKIVSPLPGSQPYFNKRPLNVPQRFDGMTLLDFLSEWHPQVARSEWERKIKSSEIVPGQRYGRRRRRMKSPEEKPPLSPDRTVRGGERFEHLLPETTEPDVAGNLEILFEDEQFIVISKPAPLPLHASGRFNRNTVQYILNELYRPEHPLIVHRLDANTSGVLVLSRKRAVARAVQPQFEARSVRKSYVARVHGIPQQKHFECVAAISSSPMKNGLRKIDDQKGLQARTEFTLLKTFDDNSSLLEAKPLTGRTNQIRIHLWHLGHSVVGDPAYLPEGTTGECMTLSVDSSPMCLHAVSIELHDQNGELRHFESPLPDWAL